MSDGLVAGLAGGALAIAASLLAQQYADRRTTRRRCLQLAGQFLATLKSVHYVSSLVRHEPNSEHALAAVEVQRALITYGYEFEALAPRRVRSMSREALSAGLQSLCAATDFPPASNWDSKQTTLTIKTRDIDAAIQRRIVRGRLRF